jgi:hypothetical protein
LHQFYEFVSLLWFNAQFHLVWLHWRPHLHTIPETTTNHLKEVWKCLLKFMHYFSEDYASWDDNDILIPRLPVGLGEGAPGRERRNPRHQDRRDGVIPAAWRNGSFSQMSRGVTGERSEEPLPFHLPPRGMFALRVYSRCYQEEHGVGTCQYW